MKLTVLASGSTGNGYLLSNGYETLIIEAGVKLSKVKEALDFDLSSIVGCLISHAHLDHSKYLEDYAKGGIEILTSLDVIKKQKNLVFSTRCKAVSSGRGYRLGNFKIVPFDVQHDVPCLGFLIYHPDSGNIAFLTDTFMTEYTFKGLNHIILEANYADDILDDNIASGRLYAGLRPRLMAGHMELKTCIDILRANDLTGVINIVLCHLSSGNSDEARFIREVQEATGKQVYTATKGLEVNFDLNPY